MPDKIIEFPVETAETILIAHTDGRFTFATTDKADTSVTEATMLLTAAFNMLNRADEDLLSMLREEYEPHAVPVQVN